MWVSSETLGDAWGILVAPFWDSAGFLRDPGDIEVRRGSVKRPNVKGKPFY